MTTTHENVILLAQTGSRMWGTATETSDYDYKGIYVSTVQDVLDPFGEKAAASKTVVADNTETTYYELRHFARLVCKGNPSMMEAVYSPHVTVATELGRLLRQRRGMFFDYEAIYRSHRGFMVGQQRAATDKINGKMNGRPIGKLLSSSIIGGLQALDLMFWGDYHPDMLLVDASDLEPWRTRSFHIELKSGELVQNQIEEAMDAIHMLLYRMDDLYQRDRRSSERGLVTARKDEIREFINTVYLEGVHA